jgi:predicted metal-dependent phosphoesterase TrpH
MRFIHPRDCYSSPVDVYRSALESGMRYVAITDHDSITGALELLARPDVDPERIIMGEEVECIFPETGQWVHVNVLGLAEKDHAELQRLRDDVRELCAYCRRRGLLHVLNHPFQSYIGQKPLEAYLEDIFSLFTHVEGLNGSVPALQNRAVSMLCRSAGEQGLKLVQVGGSDAHTLRRVGKAYTEARARSSAEFLGEIRAGACGVGGDTLSSAGLARDVYAVIARYYARLYSGRGEAEGIWPYAVDAAVAGACLPAVFAQLPLAIVLGNQVRQKAVSLSVLSRLAGLDWSGLSATPRPFSCD